MGKSPACQGCPWENESYGYIKPSGTASNGIVLVGDYPELGDIDQGVPFSSGRGGDMMRRCAGKLGSYGLTYLVHCHPKFLGKPRVSRRELSEALDWQDAFVHCQQHIVQPAIKTFSPKVIVPLGVRALKECTNTDATDRCRGYVYRNHDIPIIGTYHPEHVGAGNTGLLFTLRYDLTTALKKADPKFGTEQWTCTIDPKTEEFNEFIDRVIREATWCVVDIETPRMETEDESEYHAKHISFEIIRMSFCASNNPSHSVTIDMKDTYRPAILRLMQSGLDIIYWNGDFDDPRLAFNKFVRTGRFVDAMWLWHFLQPDLPRSLAHVSTYYTQLPEWKSKSAIEPAYYSAADAYAEAQCYYGIQKDLEKYGMSETADRHVTQLLGVLRKMIKRGVQTDPKAILHVRAVAAAKLKEWDDAIQALYPDKIKKTKWYKKTPKGAVEGATKSIGGKSGRFIKDGEKWGFRFDFNPAAAAQIKAYLTHCGIKIPKKHKTRRETTDSKAMNRILAQYGDPLIEKLLGRAKVAKVCSTYTSWTVDDQDRVHPNFSLTPATGRLSCERPNFQNNPKEGDWADLIRACIIASPGHTLITADYVGMESYLTGYFAEDPTYMRLSTMNIYAYIAAQMGHWGLPDENDTDAMKKCLASYKIKAKQIIEAGETKSLYDKIKTIVLGIGYGEGSNTLFYSNPGLFRSLSEAQGLRNFVLNAFPKVKEWQQRIVRIAGKNRKLVNPFGYVRWFHDCPGSESSRAMAQDPQSTGAAIVKEVMIQQDSTELSEHLVMQIHDELVWDVPNEMVPEACDLIMKLMTQPWPQLNGHSIAVSMKSGQNLRDLEEIQ